MDIDLFEIELDESGYDDSGAYWGAGEPLFCAAFDNGDTKHFRATNTDDARDVMQARYPLATITLAR
jgi:hypothetical protein